MHRPIRSHLATVLALGIVATAMVSTAAGDEKTAAGANERQAVLGVLSQLETGFNAGDAKALAACWTENGEFIGPTGTRADGREDIQKQFQEAFAARKAAAKLQLQVNHMRLVNKELALVEAVAEVNPAPNPGGPGRRLRASEAKRPWSSKRPRETAVHLPPEANRLKQLDWLIGDWSSETSPAGITLRAACGWTTQQAFLIRKFKVEGKAALLHGGTEVIGWDPRTSRIRSWVFDSDGGFGENVWVRDGNRWLVKYSGTMTDGSEASATHIVTKVDTDTIRLESKDRIVNGGALPDIPETVLKRQTADNPASKAQADAH